MNIVIWQGCYEDGWRGLIVPDAFTHPAKMARRLIVRIYDELFAIGALRRGDVVVDPFGGIGTTGIEGASRGIQVICCELEPKFVGLAQQNFDLHRLDWETMGRPLPQIVNGDSRQLRQHVAPALAACVVSSPPYVSGGHHADVMGAWNANGGGHGVTKDEAGYGRTKGQLGQMKEGEVAAVISSPPYAGNDKADNTKHDRDPLAGRFTGVFRGSYGRSDGQLGAMLSGQVEAVISSPPYAEISSGSGGLNTLPPKHAGQQGGRSAASASQDTDSRYGTADGQLARLALGAVDAVVSSPPFLGARSDTQRSVPTKHGGPAAERHHTTQAGAGYGDDPTNLANLASGDVDAVVSSPPYEGSLHASRDGIDWSAARRESHGGGEHQAPGSSAGAAYPALDGNVGNSTGETFWSAAKQIVEESFAILKPGGVAVWVVKAFVRDRQIVDFPGDWRKLCEAIGFETFTEAHAMLVHEEVRSHLFDGEVTKRRERKSFFRRLAEKKGSPPIDFEVVYFMRKPEVSL